MDISVLIVNYNTAALVKKCIESLLKQRDVSFEMIVVDNNSRDESVKVLEQFGDKITLIANQDNKGFGRANNQAFKKSSGRYLFLLNPDAVCMAELDLHQLVTYMNAHTHYGLVGTRIIDSNNEVQATAWKYYPRQRQTTVDYSQLPGKWATVLGASMVIRRDAYLAVGGFDEDYFLYAEETDLCLRIRKQGYKIGYYDKVTVQHVGGASEKSHRRDDVFCKKRAGKYLFYRKHYPKEDVIKLLRRDARQAQFQLFLLSLKKMFLGLTEKQKARLSHYAIARDLAKQELGVY